jgi:hypothetical protein
VGGLTRSPTFRLPFSPAAQRGFFWTLAAGIGEADVAARKQVELALFYDAKHDLVP